MAILLAIHAKEKTLNKGRYEEFSTINQFFSNYQRGMIYFGALLAIISVFLFVNQVIKLVQILFE